MRKFQQKNFLSILESFQEMHDIIIKKKESEEYDLCQQLLIDCQQFAIDLGMAIEQIEKNSIDITKLLEIYCEYVYKLSYNLTTNKSDDILSKLQEIILQVREQIDKHTSKKINILFLPYKASMWNSFDSIWKCAVKDNDCEVNVVPIPFYKIGEHSKSPILEYEGNKFPDYVPIIFYEDYCLEKECPDLIFIHNPYDDTNNLTRVPSEYFSTNLKKYTGKLIYSPYFTMRSYTKGKSEFFILQKGAIYSDKIILQSEYVKNIYESCGFKSEKLLAYGSPKIDAVINGMKKKREMPIDWQKKLCGKKIFLLNTHLLYFSKGMGMIDHYGFNFAERYHDELFEAILNKKNCGLIWRPHPLLFDALETRFPECKPYVDTLIRKIKESNNCILDTTADYLTAFYYSDALITTYSSLINEYIVTGKPIMIFQKKPSDEIAQNAPIDTRTCYFRRKADGGMTFSDFIDMILRGDDPKFEERMGSLKEKAFANMDGTAGEKILEYLKNELIQ